jgi:hypothetical protein
MLQTLLRIALNGFIIAAEAGCVIAVAALGYHYPLWFAALTASLALLLGITLEYARLKNEIPFYFDRARGPGVLIASGVALVEAVLKAGLAGIVALLTFSGTDQQRLFWIAVIFGVTTYVGANALRWLDIRFRARPLRWGYFRLAAPLGLLFSAGVSLLPAPGMMEVARRAAFDLPAKPSLEQGSEFLFALKQTFDQIVVQLLGWIFDPQISKILGILVSVNVLTGFVASLYAMLIADMVRRGEEHLV